ncbi:MAG: hypothetical protein R3343_06585 [Nitriliruptorales bacterium]|nr:hypothetical protein [Nitriliruptorales bacterium]
METEAPTGSLLLRVPVAPTTPWPRQLPPVGGSTTVTVTVSDADDLSVPPDDLLGTGYRPVGVLDTTPAGCVHVLVTPSLQRSQPDWWSQLLELADRVFDLRMGPVRRVFEDEIAIHVQALPPR